MQMDIMVHGKCKVERPLVGGKPRKGWREGGKGWREGKETHENVSRVLSG